MTPWQKARAAVRAARRASALVIGTCDQSAECEFDTARSWVRELAQTYGVTDAQRILALAASGR